MYCDAHIVGASYVILTEADLAYLKALEAWLDMYPEMRTTE
jgi:predicted aconitase